jgi:hypothetical protein
MGEMLVGGRTIPAGRRMAIHYYYRPLHIDPAVYVESTSIAPNKPTQSREVLTRKVMNGLLGIYFSPVLKYHLLEFCPIDAFLDMDET